MPKKVLFRKMIGLLVACIVGMTPYIGIAASDALTVSGPSVDSQSSSSIRVINPFTDDGNFTFYAPPNLVGTRFNASISVFNVTNLFTQNVRFTVNDTLLDVIRAWHPTWDPEWVFYGLAPYTLVGPYFEDIDDNGSNETVEIGATLTGPPTGYNGSGLLVIIECEIIYTPTEESSSYALDINQTNTYLLDFNLSTISASKINGYLEINLIPGLHDVAVTAVVPSNAATLQNDSLSINVTIENQGSYVESFNVTAYYGSNIIETKLVTDLAPFAQTVLTFDWNTTGLGLGSYGILAVADTVSGETDTADNSLSGGTVSILDWVGAVMYVNPPVTHAEVNETITVEIKVKNVTGLWAVQVGLNYDPTKLEFIEATLPGEFPFESTLGPWTDLKPDLSPGHILWGAVSVKPEYDPAFNGTTVLVRLAFKVVAPGSSEIVLRLADDYLRSGHYYDLFWECMLLDSGLNDIPFRSLDGEVTTETDWPMYKYDMACTGFSPSKSPSTNATVWISDLPGGTVWAHPVVAEGKVFIGAGGYLNAFDEEDGSLLWSFSAPGQPGYPVVTAVADGRVFFGTAEPGPEGAVYALNTTTGEELWNFTTEGYLGPLVAARDRLYFGVSLVSTGKVYCINATDGAHIWDYPTQDKAITVAVAYDNVYVGCGHWTTSATAAIYCLNLYNGDLIWSFDTGRDLGGLGSVTNGKVYCVASREGSNHAIFALNAYNGAVVWSTTRYSSGEGGAFAVAYGKVFFGTGRGSKGVYALNETNGDEIWALPFPSGAAAGGPVVADGKVFVAEGNPSHTFYAINETTGAVIWKYELAGSVHSRSIAIANGRVFVADHYASKLYAFGPKHDVAVTAVVPSKPTVQKGYSVPVNVTVENHGTYTESFDVTLYANTTAIQTQTVVDLAPAEQTTLIFTWSTIGFSTGTYTMKAYATPVQDELDTSDNTLIDDSISITGIGWFIIVAGRLYIGDPLQDYINNGCNETFKILREVGYNGDRIYYMNQPGYDDQDVDGDGENDIDALATSANLQWAIETWALNRVDPNDPLFLYIFDHGGEDVFSIDSPNGDEVTSTQLESWFNTLETATNAPIHLIYVAGRSGTFIDELSETGRVVISSCQSDQNLYMYENWECFSKPFWTKILAGHSVAWSFEYACEKVEEILNGWQTPLLDDNGDGSGHTAPLPSGGDGFFAFSLFIGSTEWAYPWTSHVVRKQFYTWPPPPTIEIWAKVENKTPLIYVKAWMIPSDWEPPLSDTVLLEEEFVCFEMVDHDNDGNWTVNIPAVNFTDYATGPSDFKFIITAKQENGMVAIPTVTGVGFTETGSPPTDNTPPRVYVERPLDGHNIKGIININGTVTDNICLQKVEIYINGHLHGTVNLMPTSNSFFQLDLNTTTIPNGSATIQAKVFDTSNNTDTQTLTVFINNFNRDIAVTDITSSKTVIGQGFALNINITVANHGSYSQIFNVTIYCNATAITLESGYNYTTITLASGEFTVLSLSWNTTDFPKGKYLLSAYAQPALGETDTTDNLLIYGWIIVAMVGDITGPEGWPDGQCNMRDVGLIARKFGLSYLDDEYDANCDITGPITGVADGNINMRDVGLVARHFGEVDP